MLTKILSISAFLGMNAALRSSVRAALFLGCQVFLIKEVCVLPYCIYILYYIIGAIASYWLLAPTINLGTHQNTGPHTGACANAVLLTYLRF